MKTMRSLAFILALFSLLITNVVAREYSPTTGRYIQFDPTGLDGGWNGFTYVSNDPLGWYDDNGLAQKKPTPSIAPASPIAGGGVRSSQWQSIPTDLAPYKIPMAGGNGGAGAGRGLMGLPGCPPVFPKAAQGMDQFLGLEGKRVPDTAATPGRGKVVWQPNSNTKITLEQHPYHPNAPEWHRGPHYHVDTPGKSHERFLPGDKIPGY